MPNPWDKDCQPAPKPIRACSKSKIGYKALGSVDVPDVTPNPLAACAAALLDSADCTARSAAATVSVLLPALLDENDRRCLPGCQSSTKQSEYRLVIEVPE